MQIKISYDNRLQITQSINNIHYLFSQIELHNLLINSTYQLYMALFQTIKNKSITFLNLHTFSIVDKKTKLFPHLIKKQLPPAKIYPDQYPKQLNDTNTSLLYKGRPIKSLTPRGEVPSEKDRPQDQRIQKEIYGGKFKSPENSYALNIGILGPVNSGKSSLMAKLAHKVSAISPKAHTTTQIIHSIKSYQVNTQLELKNVQLKYFDTPGLYQNKGNGFITKGWKVLSEIDFAMFVVDSNKRFDDIIKIGIQRIEKHKNSEEMLKALVLNKVDLVDSKRRFQNLISQIQKYGKFDKIFYTSAQTQYGIKQLQNYLINMAKKDLWQHPKETKMLLTQRQYYQQLLKQGIFRRTYQQVPFEISIECVSIVYKSNNQQQIKFKIGVPTENQQRLIIGKQGKNIEVIRNHFVLQYVKMKKMEPIVHISVSLMNKTNKKYNESTEIIFEEDYAMNKSKLEVGLLKNHLINKKLSSL